AQWDHLTRAISYVKSSNVFSAAAKIAVRLHINLPLQSETIEVVDQRASHKGLHSFVQLVQLNLFGHCFGVVHLYANLGNAKQRRSHDTSQLRAFAGLGHE